MFLNSIRWRLQIWYGLILLFVLAGFGVTAFQMESGRQIRRIDDELHRRVAALLGAWNLPPRGGGPEGSGFGPPDMRRRQPEDGRRPFPPGGERPPRTGDRPRDVEGNFELPLRVAALFDEADTNGFYYVIGTVDGRELARTTNAPPGIVLNSNSLLEPGFDPSRRQDPLPAGRGFGRQAPEPGVTRANFREVRVQGRGQIVLVGRSIQVELAELQRTGWKLFGIGGVILLLGAAGGWWLATRAIRPIEEISGTAVKISAGDLSQRINVAETKSELGQLANVLNSTFSRLENAFTQQKQFTSDAAHELRTPVSVMLTQTQTSLNRERSATEYRDTVEACQRSAQRMRRLIESLLELARLDAGQESLRRSNFDLARTAADSVELIRPLAAERNIAVQTNFSSVECTGDADRIGQVITNLLTNAVHYNRSDGEVRISTRRDGAFAVIEVEDNGPGIPPEHLPHIFQRFYRVDPARTTSQGRSGLGLAISKAIVEAHGGSLDASSTVGQGSVFTVRLPAN